MPTSSYHALLLKRFQPIEFNNSDFHGRRKEIRAIEGAFSTGEKKRPE